MKRIADDLFALELDLPGGAPPYALGVFLMGGVLVDAGIRQLAGPILERLRGRAVEAHALTHAHMDHQGSSHEVCEALGIPLWCPAGEADAVERGELLALVPDLPENREQIDVYAGPAHPVARRLAEGDEVGGFVVLETPGHSPGHVSYWRETDRMLVVGDALRNWDSSSGEIGLAEPLDVHTVDPPRNRRSIRRLAALDPLVCCFGHGPALADPDALHAFAAALPD